MKTIEEVGKKWVKKSLQAYLGGEKDLRWIAGILSGLNKEEIQALLSSAGHYGLPERRKEFRRWFNQETKSGM